MDMVSGSAATFSAVLGVSVSSVAFYVQQGSTTTLAGSMNTATVADSSTGGGLYQLTFDSTAFSSSADYVVSSLACPTSFLWPDR